jgi:putative Holliday junction resolvase
VTVSGTLIGFDFGERRIGVAVGDTAVGIARPVGVIAEPTNAARLAAIDRLEATWQPAAFVVGQPRHADGSEHAVGLLAAKFARRLAARYHRPVMLVDETLSSAEAERHIREAAERKMRTAEVDAVAAQVILQSYLDDPSHAHAAA